MRYYVKEERYGKARNYVIYDSNTQEVVYRGMSKKTVSAICDDLNDAAQERWEGEGGADS